VRTKRWIEVDGRFAIGEGGGELFVRTCYESGGARAAVLDSTARISHKKTVRLAQPPPTDVPPPPGP
jgi:hypothetical protein